MANASYTSLASRFWNATNNNPENPSGPDSDRGTKTD